MIDLIIDSHKTQYINLVQMEFVARVSIRI